jgi:hypothetical protein
MYHASYFLSVQEIRTKTDEMPVGNPEFGCFNFVDADLDALNFSRNPDSWEEDFQIGVSWYEILKFFAFISVCSWDNA